MNEILMIYDNKTESDRSGIFIYNIHSKQLALIAKYPDDCMYAEGDDFHQRFIMCHASYNKICNKVLIYFRFCDVKTPDQHKLIEFDITSKSLRRYDHTLPQKGLLAILWVNEQLHFWSEDAYHYIYDQKTGQTVSNRYVEQGRVKARDCEVVYIPSQNKIILIVSGRSFNRDGGTFYYCLKGKKWNKIMDFNKSQLFFGKPILTQDERHIIITQAWNESNDICIIDMSDRNEYKVRKSKVFAPSLGENYWCRKFVMMSGGVNDEIIVYGYVRLICMEYKIDMIVPDVMSVIAIFSSREMLHCVKLVAERYEKDMDNEHWMIDASFVVSE